MERPTSVSSFDESPVGEWNTEDKVKRINAEPSQSSAFYAVIDLLFDSMRFLLSAKGCAIRCRDQREFLFLCAAKV